MLCVNRQCREVCPALPSQEKRHGKRFAQEILHCLGFRRGPQGRRSTVQRTLRPWAAYGILTELGASAADCFYAVVGPLDGHGSRFFDAAAGSHPYCWQKLSAVAGNPPVYLRAGENAVFNIKLGRTDDMKQGLSILLAGLMLLCLCGCAAGDSGAALQDAVSAKETGVAHAGQSVSKRRRSMRFLLANMNPRSMKANSQRMRRKNRQWSRIRFMSRFRTKPLRQPLPTIRAPRHSKRCLQTAR